MQQLHAVLRAMCKTIRTPVARAALQLANDGKWLELQKLQVHPSSYSTAETYWQDRMVVDLVRKVPLPGSSPKAAAVATFWENEGKCALTNHRLRRFLPEEQRIEPLSHEECVIRSHLKLIQAEVRAIMGYPGDLDYEFTMGATTGNSVPKTTITDKLSARPQWYRHSIGRLARPFYLSPLARCMVGQGSGTNFCDFATYGMSGWGTPQTTRGGHFFSVPKNSDTERGCMKEASLNVAYQRGEGIKLRERLKRQGIDLLQGQQKHQDLARRGSLTGEYATLDMSSASDLWASTAVKLLVPKAWYMRLDSLRAKVALVDKTWVHLQKFSSMGNGFTFELETILFLAVCRVAASLHGFPRDSVSVYGDDMVVPTKCARYTVAVLRFLGHEPNTKKTFIEGPFRESCGGDFFSGVAVNTVKLESLPTEPHQWIAFANALRRVTGGCPQRWALLRPAWRMVLDQLPSQIRSCRGPEQLGDVVIHDAEQHWSVKGATHPPKLRAWLPVSEVVSLDHFWPIVVLTACTRVSSEGVTPRALEATSYRLGWMPLGSQWLPTVRVR